MAEQRKKMKTGGKGKEATARKPRSRKVRKAPPAGEATSGPVNQPLDEQIRKDIPTPPNPVSGGLRALLPGELYRRQDQWWWRVQLPGEDKLAARPLKTNGEETPADGQEAAAKIALAMWEHAIEEDTTRRIRLESTEKIERLKAQFLDKVRHFTELVETANAKVEAEQRARAEVEAKLAQAVRAAGPRPQDTRQPAMKSRTQAPVVARQGQAKQPMSTPVPEPPAVAAPVPAAAQSGRTRPIVAPAVAPLPASTETGLCECCGATGIAMTHLTRIDSGQLLCPRCLAALRTEATRSA